MDTLLVDVARFARGLGGAAALLAAVLLALGVVILRRVRSARGEGRR